jgi:hypothetical protein
MGALQYFDVTDGRLGLLEWSEPVIFDRLRHAYRQRVFDDRAGLALTRLHCRVWRALIAGDMAAFEKLRTALISALEQHGLELGSLAEADAQTMAELVEIVIARFQRSERIAKGYHLALMDLASRLTLADRAA